MFDLLPTFARPFADVLSLFRAHIYLIKIPSSESRHRGKWGVRPVKTQRASFGAL
jgi:hypothetical protein